ncbi:ATP-binding protein [Butyrivibrio sp. VCD2006]|uniref:ATP-binding protein n=1 Tax=Butyrivibrio sp. VCD2006 TaxID=1280664 RepID=UPI0003F9728F|nr:ATP-binding protein [Butyrivibrio sp. VCD2006]
MNKNLQRVIRQMSAVLVVFALLMGVLGLYFQKYLWDIINNMVERRIMREAETAADFYYEELSTEMMTIEHIGLLLEDERTTYQEENIIQAKNVIETVFKNEPSILMGIMNGEGEAVYGERIPPNEYDALLSTMTGNDGISYMDTGAFLFSHSILHGDNVSYVIYSLCSTAYIKKHHSLDFIHNLGAVSLMTRDGDEVLPFLNVEEKFGSFYRSKSVRKVFERLRLAHNLEPAGVERVKTIYGDMYFYVAQIENTHFILTGAISVDEAMGDYKSIPYMVMAVYLILFFIMIILSIVLMNFSVKVRESEELKIAKKAAEDASKAKGMFLANMSHEIRTPINAILGMNELITRETRNENVQKYAFSIKSSANQLLTLVNDVLDFSKMEAGKFQLRYDTYYLSAILTDVNVMIRGKAESKGLIYNVHVDQEIPDALVGDETRLKQVLINLLTNSVKYTMAGFVELSISYESKGEDYIDVRFSVKDTGIGMKEEDIKKLFLAFQRLDEDRNKTIEGTGLGMSIVKQILDAMETTLDVKSVYGKGSEFSFIVRQKVDNWEPIGDYVMAAERLVTRQESYKPSFVAPSVRILAVDDTDINLRVVSGLLNQTKIKVDTALSGKQALEMMIATKYDLALIDHRMPVMDGVELLKHIRENKEGINHDIPCIALTANVFAGIREMYIKVGFDDYLEKPVSGARLEEMLMKYLPQDKLQDESELTDEDASVEETSSQDEEPSENATEADVLNKLRELQDKGYVDIDAGVSYAGSEEDFIDIVRLFRDTIDKKSEEIRELYDAGNIEEYTTKVHALKTAARIIGAMDVSEKARLLEMAGKENNLDYIKENTEKVLEEYGNYKKILEII